MFGSTKGVGPPLLAWIGIMVVMTIMAAGVGGVLGIQLVAQVKTVEQQYTRVVATGPEPKYGANVSLIDLPPIITNIAEPPTSWIRLQASIVYDNKAVAKPQVLAAQISEDILAYLKTVTLAQIGGASGLEHLREDLNERAAIRSDGHVHAVIIQTVVVQ